jgi:hypothetical protein
MTYSSCGSRLWLQRRFEERRRSGVLWGCAACSALVEHSAGSEADQGNGIEGRVPHHSIGEPK